MSPKLSRRLLAMTVAVALLWLPIAPRTEAAGTALFQGRVVSADGVTPRSGVTVALVDAERGSVFRSTPTDERGVFHLDSAAPGSYTLIAEVPEGAFVAQGTVSLDAGNNPAVALALQPMAQQEGEPQELASQDAEPQDESADTPVEPEADEVAGEPETSTPPPSPEKREGLSPVVKGVIAGVVGILAVATVYLASEEEDPGSPF
jgi:hypothetical protein